MEKEKILERQEQILALLKTFCKAKLDDEYAFLSEKMLKKLGRKRSVPFISGKPEVWAVGIIHALGTVNFLFDKSFEPYISLDELNDFFGTKKTTTGSKSKEIRDLLKMRNWGNEFSTKKMIEDNPFTKMAEFEEEFIKSLYVSVDGEMIPINTLPEDIQNQIKQARAEGLDIYFTIK